MVSRVFAAQERTRARELRPLRRRPTGLIWSPPENSAEAERDATARLGDGRRETGDGRRETGDGRRWLARSSNHPSAKKWPCDLPPFYITPRRMSSSWKKLYPGRFCLTRRHFSNGCHSRLGLGELSRKRI